MNTEPGWYGVSKKSREESNEMCQMSEMDERKRTEERLGRFAILPN